jgi:hypothetical protein
MKKTLLLLLLLLPIIGFSQPQNEAGSTHNVELGATPIITEKEAAAVVDFAEPSSIQVSPQCSDKERRIAKMKIDILCDSLSAEDLGFDCEEMKCPGGVHDGFIAQRSIYIGDPDCRFIVKVVPVQSKLPVGNIWRGNQGNSPMDWIFICKDCEYKRGEVLILD